MVFIDFKAAVDSAKRDAIWQLLENQGLPCKLLNTIKNMFTDTTSCVRKNGMLFDLFSVNSGVRHGVVLSPFLFNLFNNWVMNVATDGTNNGITQETVISNLDFADDICLLEDNADDAQSLLNRVVAAAAKEVGLIVNSSKTKCMFAQTEPVVLYLDFNPLKNITEFVYLGSRISSNGNISTEVQNRIARATANSSRIAKF